MMRSIVALAVVILVTINRVSAHPGHGNEDGSVVRHISGSPLHLAEIAAGIILVAGVFSAYRHLQQRRQMRVNQR